MKLKDTFMSSPICVKILKYQCIPNNFPLLCRQFFQFITLKQTILSANYNLQTFFLQKKVTPPDKKYWSVPYFSGFLILRDNNKDTSAGICDGI